MAPDNARLIGSLRAHVPAESYRSDLAITASLSPVAAARRSTRGRKVAISVGVRKSGSVCARICGRPEGFREKYRFLRRFQDAFEYFFHRSKDINRLRKSI